MEFALLACERSQTTGKSYRRLSVSFRNVLTTQLTRTLICPRRNLRPHNERITRVSFRMESSQWTHDRHARKQKGYRTRLDSKHLSCSFCNRVCHNY